MSLLRICRGLPGSGKSTLARAWATEEPASRLRVNRDDLRMMLHGTDRGLTPAQEQLVTRIEQDTVRAALARGIDVIVDDMNLRARYVRDWAVIAQEAGADIQLVNVEIPLDEAIARDSRRPRPVGEQVIRDLAARFTQGGRLRAVDLAVPAPAATAASFDAYVRDAALPEAVVVDIDGTLAHIVGEQPRSPYDMTRVLEDELDENVARTVRALQLSGLRTVLVSGRTEDGRADTQAWLAGHEIEHDALFMRPVGDQRGDDVVKHEILHRDIAPRWNVRFTIDDRNRVVAMWRASGIPCFQVAPGDF